MWCLNKILKDMTTHSPAVSRYLANQKPVKVTAAAHFDWESVSGKTYIIENTRFSEIESFLSKAPLKKKQPSHESH